MYYLFMGYNGLVVFHRDRKIREIGEAPNLHKSFPGVSLSLFSSATSSLSPRTCPKKTSNQIKLDIKGTCTCTCLLFCLFWHVTRKSWFPVQYGPPCEPWSVNTLFVNNRTVPLSRYNNQTSHSMVRSVVVVCQYSNIHYRKCIF